MELKFSIKNMENLMENMDLEILRLGIILRCWTLTNCEYGEYMEILT